jgi:hypothetical protein
MSSPIKYNSGAANGAKISIFLYIVCIILLYVKVPPYINTGTKTKIGFGVFQGLSLVCSICMMFWYKSIHTKLSEITLAIPILIAFVYFIIYIVLTGSLYSEINTEKDKLTEQELKKYNLEKKFTNAGIIGGFISALLFILFYSFI